MNNNYDIIKDEASNHLIKAIELIDSINNTSNINNCEDYTKLNKEKINSILLKIKNFLVYRKIDFITEAEKESFFINLNCKYDNYDYEDGFCHPAEDYIREMAVFYSENIIEELLTEYLDKSIALKPCKAHRPCYLIRTLSYLLDDFNYLEPIVVRFTKKIYKEMKSYIVEDALVSALERVELNESSEILIAIKKESTGYISNYIDKILKERGVVIDVTK